LLATRSILRAPEEAESVNTSSLPLRWGLVGLGRHVSEEIVPAMRRSTAVEVVACAGRDVAAAGAFAERFAIAKVHDAFEDLVLDRDVDAVFVATPNTLHAAVVLAAARAGKHVLCEKPLALTAADGHAMVSACRAARVQLRVALHLRFERSLQRVAEILQSGAIGTPRALSIERTAPLAERVPWRSDPKQGGDILFDVGVHLLDLVPRLLATEITAISGLATPEPATSRSADTVTILLRLGNGVQAMIRASRETPFAGNDLVVVGTAGMLRAGPLRWAPEHRITVTTEAGTTEETLPAGDLYRAEIEAFAEDLRDNGHRLATGEEGVHLVALTEAVQRALR
jgi:1,5-anhydro-D-fructose reductase (1,5-anhydro-D-mannitol-forming)